MSIYVLGTHTSHDGSACLLKDGRIVVAIEKERITRQKHAGGPDDHDAIDYCLDVAGIRIEDVDLVVQNDNFHNFEHPLIPQRLAGAQRVETISHHLGHAYSAIGTSPFETANVLIVDGCGSPFNRCLDLGDATIPEAVASGFEHLECEKDSFYAFEHGRLTSVYKDFSVLQDFGQPVIAPNTTMHSIGGAYLGVSTYVFRGLEDPGKLMGLSPYGRPDQVKAQLFELKDGRVFVNYECLDDFDHPAHSYAEFKENFQYYADIACWAQREIERALLYVVRHRYELRPCPNLCYAGGVALNAVANHLIMTETPYEQVYIQPAAGDNGLAIGCAYYGWLEVLGQPRVPHSGSTYFGRQYGRDSILAALRNSEASTEYQEVADVTQAAAQALNAGKVLGWFQGGSEFGPRALGHRSILALPDKAETRDFINGQVKFREDFRPFAPSVPSEDVARYFEQNYDSPYMILVSRVREEWRDRLPAVVHVNQSARVQTVHKALTPRYHELHRKVEALSGASVLLNTSFNRRGMPIVETPQQAIDMLLESALDMLVIGDFVVTKRAAMARTSQQDPDAMINSVVRRLQGQAAAAHRHSLVIQLTELEESLCIDFGRRTISVEDMPNPDFTVRCPGAAFARLVAGETDLDAALSEGILETPGLKDEERGRLLDSLRTLLRD